MLKIRRSRDRLIFIMGIPIPGKDGLYLRRGPDSHPGKIILHRSLITKTATFGTNMGM